MSVQFGRWNLDGKPVDRDYLAKVKLLLAPYGPDEADSYSEGNISILYRAFRTTKECRLETQPHATPSSVILTWDGRLDNRADLIRQLPNVQTTSLTDVEIVAAAYEYWRNDCFSMLIGDWALSIWDPHTRSLTLVKDPIGTRHLYYSFDDTQITWSSILDPLVLFAGKTFSLCEEYIAGYFSHFSATHLTPYVGIHSVSPASSVQLRIRKQTICKYWDFDPSKRILYRTDAEYEEHFRAVFGEAVRRRLRSDRPVLAELSGGMDSSCIVCMADTIIAQGTAEAPRLDTVSYYNDSEPSWNEYPYFTKVELRRGRTGCHIDVGSEESFKFEPQSGRFKATPGSSSHPSQSTRQFAACITAQENLVVLSGFAGDEVMGGVPTPTPEIEDLLARGHFKTLVHQLKIWGLNKRKPWFHLFLEAVRSFFPPALFGGAEQNRFAPWLNRKFVKRNRAALHGYEKRLSLFGPLPSFQDNLSSLEALRRHLQCYGLPSEPPYEKRYPYLDRTLLEFMYAVPREQLVRPGQRRSLVRRALVGIVPSEILNRKRKAYVSRAPRVALSAGLTSFVQMPHHMVSGSLMFLDTKKFSEALQKAHQEQSVPMVFLMRTLGIETWLRGLSKFGILVGVDEISQSG
jgi:asparagine synthase (glutamine-hydrolysing)